MERIPPSEKLRKDLREMMNSVPGNRFLVSDLVTKAARLFVQEIREQELTDFLRKTA